MAAGQLWAGVDVGKEHHWVCVVDNNGTVVLSRKFANDEQPIRELIGEVDSLSQQVSWTVDLTTAYASLLLTVLADAGKAVRYLAGRAVWQASVTYRGGEAKTDAKDARVIADQSRMPCCALTPWSITLIWSLTVPARSTGCVSNSSR